jgi:hypothetical protein
MKERLDPDDGPRDRDQGQAADDPPQPVLVQNLADAQAHAEQEEEEDRLREDAAATAIARPEIAPRPRACASTTP